MPRTYYVYILSNQTRCLYVGVTGDMHRRWHQHRHGAGSTFCRRQHITRLVFIETCSRPVDAIAREKQIKGWARAKKVALVTEQNPGWVDLAVAWGWRDPPASSGPRRVR